MKVKLGDVCIIQSGGTPSRSNLDYWKNGTISWVKISDIKDKYLNFTEEYITYEGLKNSSAKIFSKGTILYTIFATLGEVSILNIEAATNQAIAGIKLVDENVYNDFLYYYLVSKKEEVNNRGRGVAQNNINLSMLKNIEIEMPNIEKQRKIANVLDKVNKIINKRQQQLKKLDELVKSRFIEMFGEPVTNSKMWEIDCLGNITTKIGSGMTPRGGKESYLATGVALIRSMNVHDGKFEYKDLAYISAKQAFEMKNVELIENDVLFNITGASVTRTCVVPNTILPARVNQHVAIIRCINESLNPIFLNNLFLQDGFKYKLLNLARAGGATREAITKQQLEDLNVILPPIEMQNQFADFVEQTDKSKFVNYKCLQTVANIYRQEWMRCQTSNF